MVARAEKDTMRPVPNGKGEVTDQVLDAIFTPAHISVQDQFRIRSIHGETLVAFGLELGYELGASVQTNVSDEVNPAIESEWLTLVLRFDGGLQ